MRGPHLTSAALRRLTLVNVVLLAAIIVSGAVVRLTNSGLGCADWPNCSSTKLVDVSSHHAAIEQLNRIFSGAIGIPIALALLGAYRLRPRRDDLVRLAWILFGLFWAEAVLGGISVKVRLAWVSVTGHFLLAITLIAVALVMHHRAGRAHVMRRPAVPPETMLLARAVYALTIWVIVVGTLVTAAGPHGGDVKARRLGWDHVVHVGAHVGLDDRGVLRGPVRVVGAVRGMAMTRKVEGDEWTVERERDRVPGVSILCAAVHEHELGRRRPPHQRADGAATRVDRHAAHDRRFGPGNPELGRVLGEQREFVVQRGTGHEP